MFCCIKYVLLYGGHQEQVESKMQMQDKLAIHLNFPGARLSQRSLKVNLRHRLISVSVMNATCATQAWLFLSTVFNGSRGKGRQSLLVPPLGVVAWAIIQGISANRIAGVLPQLQNIPVIFRHLPHESQFQS